MIIFPKLRLFYKFAVVMILLAVIPLAVVSWQMFNINRQGMQSAILELHTGMVTSLAERINSYIAQLDRQVQFVIKTLGTQGREAVYQSFLDSNPDYISISIVNPSGEERLKVFNPAIVKDAQLLDLGENSTFKEFLLGAKTRSAKSAISAVYFTDSKPRMDIIYPIENNPGYSVFITLSLASLWDEVSRMRSGKTGYTFLVDESGSVIAHPEIGLSLGRHDMKNLPIVSAVLQANSVGSSEYLNDKNEWIVGAYAPIKSLRWGVITEQKKKEAFYSVYQMRAQAFVLTAISILAASLIAFFFARTLTRPILRLIQGARRVAEGDFSVKVEFGRTGDEMNDLADTFNLMTGKLKEYSDMQVDKIVAEKTKTEAIIFSIDDGLIMTDHQGNLQLVNSRAKSILNLTDVDRDFLENTSIFDIIRNKEIKEQVVEVFRNPNREFFREIVISAGQITNYYKTNATMVKSLKGEELGVVTVFHDITLEKELDQMKDDFLHSITHDLRNPMTSIRGFVKFLLDGIGGPINDQQKKMLQTVDRASARLLGMINDILDIAKIESRKFDVELVEIDLKDLTNKSKEIFQPQIEKKRMEFIIESPETLSKINLDPKLIDRVFQNLIGNAIKFVPEEGGRITVKLEESDKYVRISVIDNGSGIPAQDLGRIFEKFQQVQGQKKGGTGLGLTICKFIVEAHLGSIKAQSEQGKGSSFIFEIAKNLAKNEKGQIVIQ